MLGEDDTMTPKKIHKENSVGPLSKLKRLLPESGETDCSHVYWVIFNLFSCPSKKKIRMRNEH